MKKEGNIYKTLFKIAFVSEIVVVIMLCCSFYWYEDIKNLYLLPLCYSISILLVKNYYYHGRIGMTVNILPGVTISGGVIIVANSVVTKDIPAFDLVAGVPARIIIK